MNVGDFEVERKFCGYDKLRQGGLNIALRRGARSSLPRVSLIASMSPPVDGAQ